MASQPQSETGSGNSQFACFTGDAQDLNNEIMDDATGSNYQVAIIPLNRKIKKKKKPSKQGRKGQKCDFDGFQIGDLSKTK